MIRLLSATTLYSTSGIYTVTGQVIAARDMGAEMRRNLRDVEIFGPELDRPECVLATARGDLYTSNSRGGVSIIDAGGRHHALLAKSPPSQFLPNGIDLMQDRSVLIANLSLEGGVWRLLFDGTLEPYLMEVEGKQLSFVNFVNHDHHGRCWVTVSTRTSPLGNAAVKGMADGYLVLSDRRGARIVADGLALAGEAKVHPSGSHIYVIETTGRRLSRCKILDNGDLGPVEPVCEFQETGEFPDGFSFDSEGHAWVTIVVSNKLVRVNPATGQRETWISDEDFTHSSVVESAFERGQIIQWSGGDFHRLNMPSSIAFSGPDLKTCIVGTNRGRRLAKFASPVPGMIPPYWHY